jgi:hypothetical protein
MTSTNVSKLDRLHAAFIEGSQLTARQIASRFRVANPYDMVYRLRNDGVVIERNTRINSKGTIVRYYSVPRFASVRLRKFLSSAV